MVRRRRYKVVDRRRRKQTDFSKQRKQRTNLNEPFVSLEATQQTANNSGAQHFIGLEATSQTTLHYGDQQFIGLEATTQTPCHSGIKPFAGLEEITHISSHSGGQISPAEIATPTIASSSSEAHGSIKPEAAVLCQRRHRGPTLMNDIWDLQDGIKMEVQVGVADIPVGAEASKLANFIGSVVRRSDLAPLGYKDWRLMEYGYKKAIWEAIESKIVFRPHCSEKTRTWVMRSAATKWRGWKNEIKHRVFNKQQTPLQMWEKVTDARVDKSQFLTVANIWLSDAHQKTCETNRRIRLRFDDPHCAGTKSFARLIHEKTQAEGMAPTRADIYITTRKHKDGSVVNDKAKDLMDLMQKYQNENSGLSSSQKEALRWQGDTYSKVKGPEKKGIIRCVGPVAPTKNIATAITQQDIQVQQTLNGFLHIIIGIAQMWKEQFPDANIDKIMETAKLLAGQTRAGSFEVPDALSVLNNSQSENWERDSLKNSIQSSRRSRQEPLEIPTHNSGPSDDCVTSRPPFAVPLFVETPSSNLVETLPFDPMVTEEMNSSRICNVKIPKEKRKQTSENSGPLVSKFTRNPPKRLKANTETTKVKSVDNNLLGNIEHVANVTDDGSEQNLDEICANEGTFHSMIDIGKDAIMSTQHLHDPDHGFEGNASTPKHEIVIVQSFLRDPVNKLNAHFYTPLGNFCLGKHIYTLLYGGMVEDKIIDIYMDLLHHKHSKFQKEPSFFFASLKVTQLVKIRTKRTTNINLANLLKCHRRSFENLKKVFFVMLTSNHRHLIVTDIQAKKFKVYDSLYGNKRHKREAEKWKQWISDFYTDNYTKDNLFEWDLEFMDCPQQGCNNSMDCGIYVMKFMDYLCEDKEPKFMEEDIPRFRREIAAKLLSCEKHRVANVMSTSVE